MLAEGEQDRNLWLEKRLEELSGWFAIDVAGFAVLDNHLHLLVRISPERSASWSDEEVVRRWGRLFPPRGKDRKPLPVSEAWIQEKLGDEKFVQQARRRLADLGWLSAACGLDQPLGLPGKSAGDGRSGFDPGPAGNHGRVFLRGPAG